MTEVALAHVLIRVRPLSSTCFQLQAGVVPCHLHADEAIAAPHRTPAASPTVTENR